MHFIGRQLSCLSSIKSRIYCQTKDKWQLRDKSVGEAIDKKNNTFCERYRKSGPVGQCRGDSGQETVDRQAARTRIRVDGSLGGDAAGVQRIAAVDQHSVEYAVFAA